jgi:hypothetical protein
MEELSLQRIRDLIIAAHSVSDDGILSFDTSNLKSLGFTEAEIDEANRILAAEQAECLQDYIKSQIKFCFVDPAPATIYYIGYAKLIFSISNEKQAYSYITEEDLEQIVHEMRDFIVKLQYIEANSNNDASGNQI